MAKNSSSGCLTAVIVLVVLAGVGLIGLVGLFYMRAGGTREYATELAEQVAMTEAADRAGTIVFQEGAIPRFPPHKSGDELTREQFVALMLDEHATDLARKSFEETARDTTVNWLLHTEDIFDSNGTLQGHFTLPYEIKHGRGMRGSSLTVNCEFQEESKDSLLNVRRGDWVVVQGTLSFAGQQASIKEARIVDGSAAPQAERP
jgi:hypothetical protein